MSQPSRIDARTAALWLGAALVLVCARAAAQGTDAPSLSAELSTGRAFVGDQVPYQIIVRGVDTDAVPEVAFPPTVRAQYRGAGRQTFTSTRIVNGRQRIVRDERITHEYRLTIVGEGEIEIPPARLETGTVVLRSNRVSLSARLPERSDDDDILIEIPERPVYIGETVRASVTWWIGGQTRDFSFDSSAFPDRVRIDPAPTPTGGQRAYEFEFAGQRVVGSTSRGIHRGEPMNRLRFDLLLTPEETGELTIGPVRVAFTRLDDFGRGSRRYAESETRTIRVVPVPGAGKPDAYGGLIGRFALSASASNTEVNVGDPIELRLRIEGEEPMPDLEDLIPTDALGSAGFRVAPDAWRVDRDRSGIGTRVLATTIRAERASIDRIPPIELPSFNPVAGEYTVYRSEPIPIEVRAVRRVTIEDAVTAAPIERDASRSTLTPNASVLWAHPDAAQIRAGATGLDPVRMLSHPGWTAYLAIAITAPLAAALLGVRRRSRDPDRVRMDRAWSGARRLHRSGKHAEALRLYAAGTLGIDPGALTGADLARLGVSEDLTERSRRVLVSREAHEYAGRTPEPPDRGVLHDLRRETNRRRHTHTKGARS